MSFMKLPTITNAVLTQVNDPGFEADYDRPAVLGAVKWSGSERVNVTWVQDEKTRASRGDLGLPMVDIQIERTVVVDANLPVEFAEGDVITFTRDGQAQETGKIQWLRTTEGLGLGGVTRLILDRA